MKKLITFNQAAITSLIILTLIVFFHTSILIGILLFDYAPVDFLWGGRLNTAEELLHFEIVSLLTSSIFVLLLLIRTKRINFPKFMSVAQVAMWVMFILFTLNTVGNLLAKTNFEQSFSIITGLMALLSLRLALEKNTGQAG